MTTLHRYWISWVSTVEDYRPLTYPPNAQILGWWCTGYGGEGATICALVEAESPEAAHQAIATDWPEINQREIPFEWRFINEVACDWTPPIDRFPPSDWMFERMKASTIVKNAAAFIKASVVIDKDNNDALYINGKLFLVASTIYPASICSLVSAKTPMLLDCFSIENSYDNWPEDLQQILDDPQALPDHINP